MRVLRWLLIVVVAGLAVAGLGRLRVDTDILAMLPARLPEVEGLRTLQREFSRSGELVVLLECGEEEAGMLELAAAELAGRLESTGAARRARWQPAWGEEAGEMAELLAYLWLNGEPEELDKLVERLGPARVDATLAEAVERVATSFAGMELVMRAHDPLGLLGQPSLGELIERQGSDGGFSGADGRAQLLLVDSPREVTGYNEAGEWLLEVRGVIEAWRAEGNEWVGFGFTGDPAFNAEIGGAIERDMSGTVAVTSLLIGGMFWWMQRRLGLLAGLALMIGCVFAITLGAAGWLYPAGLGVMSAGFAAVLIGLVVDYGVLICQEAKLERHDPRAIRRAVLRSIGWAAVTTAAVFATLNASSLPGIGQLGTLVAIGVGSGAVVMLGFYVPVVAKVGAGRKSAGSGIGARPFLSGRSVWGVSGVVVLVAVLVLVVRGVPGIEFDFALMRPRNSTAMETFERVRASFPGWSEDALKVVVSGGSREETEQRLERAAGELESLEEGGLLAEAWLPRGWWPDAERQIRNRGPAVELAASRDRLLEAADKAGFTEEGTALGAAVLEALGRLAGAGATVFPESGVAREVMRGFLVRADDGGGVVMGEITPVEGAVGDPALRGIQGDGVFLAGWEALRPAVMPLVRRDLRWVFLPMAMVMIGMLAVVFRRVGDVALEVLALAFSGLALSGLMVVFGLRWNFLNVAAIPLLLGTGVDYGIHMLLALRRTDGDFGRVWHGTGKAIVFCGVSTAIGFGSLSFASNEAMASMGRVCSTGILLNMLTAVFLLPGWWASSRRVGSAGGAVEGMPGGSEETDAG